MLTRFVGDEQAGAAVILLAPVSSHEHRERGHDGYTKGNELHIVCRLLHKTFYHLKIILELEQQNIVSFKNVWASF